jgi:hypothetical protein
MNHKHHSCKCKHENVRYCSTCYLVHCLDCNMEWGQKTSYWQYQPYQWNLGQLYKGDGSGTFQNPEITWTVSTNSETTCEHK